MSEIDTPQVRRRAGPSIVWLIPLITAIVGVWLITRTLIDQAPTATISFKTAEGIVAGETRIKYKSVDIGVVDAIQFAENFENIVLTATFNQGMEDFLRRNTRFWVVRPQLSFSGVSGLGTLLSGAYIEIDPGPGSRQTHFIGLETIPLITRDDAGTQITLVSDTLGSLGGGSPIYYQGLQAGEILGYELGSDAQSVFIHAFIRDPYDQLVEGNSRFWNVSGIDISMGANGVDVRTVSLQSLLFGGISFETPDTLERTSTDIENLIFTLYPSHSVIEAQEFTRKQQFVMYFNSSVRGLNPGAPLEFKGIRIGSVLDIRLEFDSEDTSFRIPILVEIEPERIISRETEESLSPLETLQTLVDRGLRGRLATGSLLTGQLFVELNMYPDTEAVYMGDGNSAYPELPTVPGAFEAITQSIQGLITKIETVDVERVGNDILGILGGVNDLLNKPKDEETVTDLQESMRALQGVLNNVEDARIGDTVTSANKVLSNLEETISLMNGVLSPNSPLQYNLIKVTGELEETAKSVRALLEMLGRRPQSLLFGRGGDKEESVKKSGETNEQ